MILTKPELITDFLKNFPNNRIFMLQEWTVNKENMLVSKGEKKIAPPVELQDVEKYNSVEYKRWMYFTPNWDYKLVKINERWVWRTAANAKNAYCFPIDIDNNDTIREDYIEPSYVVKTGKWHHVYYLFKNPVDFKQQWDKRKEHQKMIIRLYGADAKCSDPWRIYRLPYSIYWKDNIWDKEIELESWSWKLYDFDELCSRIDKIYEPLKQRDEERKNFISQGSWFVDIFDDVNKLNAWDVLEKISKRHFTVQSNREIYDWWNPTSWYKYNRSANYVNNFSDNHIDRPRWPAFAIVKYYLHDTELILNWFVDNYWINVGSVLDKYKQKLSDLKPDTKYRIETENTEMEMYGSWNFRLRLDYKDKNIYSVIIWPKWEQVNHCLNWLILPIWYIEKWWEWNREIKTIVTVVKPTWNIISTLPIMANTSDMRKYMMSFWLTYFNSNVNINNLLLEYTMSKNVERDNKQNKYIIWPAKRYKYTDKIWLQEIEWKRYFIKRWWTYFEWDLFIDLKWYPVEVYEEPKRIAMWWEWIAWILESIYDMHAIYPLFLVWIMHVFIYYFRKYGIQTPWVFLEWLKASWKTTIKNFVLKRLLWLKLSMSACGTPFPYLTWLWHYFSVNAEDFRNSWMQPQNLKIIEWLVRDAFDWNPHPRWDNSLKTNWFPTTWQIIFDWQTKFTDWAVLSRQVLIMTSPKQRRSLKWTFQIKENILSNVLDIFPSCLEFESYLESCYDIQDELAKKLSKSEVTDKWRTIGIYSLLIWLWRKLWLQKYESILDDCLYSQMTMNDTDDIYNIYSKIFTIYITTKNWNITFVDWWMVIEVNYEWTKMSEGKVEDVKWMVWTINRHFNYTWYIDWCYIDFAYVLSKKPLHNNFYRCISMAYIPDSKDLTTETQKTIIMLKWFLEQSYPDSEVLKQINLEHLVYNKWKQPNESQLF